MSSENLQPLQPILTAHLFPALERKLLELLASLTPEDWEKQTIAPKWKVKHVAAHLLDTQLRKISMCRDGVFPKPPEINSHADLVAFVNRLNESGVSIYGNLSPRVLIALMEVASRESAAFHLSLDPWAKACFSVSWAGESESLNWFDTARELTERWHHQQQIRLATGKAEPGIMTREFYHPVLDCFMRALPFHYRTISRPPATSVHFQVAGDCGGSWYLYRSQHSWQLTANSTNKEAAVVAIPQEIAWRVFTKGTTVEAAKPMLQVSGDADLALHILRMISIVA